MSRIPGRSYHPRGWQEDAGIPLRGYILGVGGALLALLFAADLLLPKPSPTGIVSASETPRIRIHSERKGPEAIVFDTTQPTMMPPTTASPTVTAADASVAAPEQAVRQSFAQVLPARPAATTGHVQRKVSARRSRKRGPVMAGARRTMRFTENARPGFFGMTW